MNWAALDAAVLLPAFLAGLVVLATHIPLGTRVLERGIIFIDLAVAQLAGLGVILVHVLAGEPTGIETQLAAFGAALAGAYALYAAERRWPRIQEALIGSAFVLAASAAVLLLARDPKGGEHLKELLVGQILWTDPASLGPPALLAILVLAAWSRPAARRSTVAFYGLFALAVTASVQLVGVYLVFATLILPALGTRGISGAKGLTLAYGAGITGYGAGLALSALFDLPAGPVIVWTLAAASGLAAITGRAPRP